VIAHLVAAVAEPSKTPFFIVGGAFAVYAVLLSVLGLRSRTFPGGEGGARIVMAVSFLIMLAAIAAAVLTDP
jgi:hypothetical protein